MDDESLCRHAPAVFADSGDRFLDGVVMHGARAGGWLQYWIAWPGDRDHAGTDWEMVMFRLESGEPVEAVYARHRTASRRPWARVRLVDGRPAVFAGRDKHASYFRRGWHRHGLHLERANGRVRIDPPLVFGEPPVGVRRRRAYRDPDGWLRRLGV